MIFFYTKIEFHFYVSAKTLGEKIDKVHLKWTFADFILFYKTVVYLK